MIKLRLTVELTYEEGLMHGTDPVDIDWFYNDILMQRRLHEKGLSLFSQEIGDFVGDIKVLEIHKDQ